MVGINIFIINVCCVITFLYCTFIYFILSLLSFSIFLLIVSVSIFLTLPLDLIILIWFIRFFHQFPTLSSLSSNHAPFSQSLFWPLFSLPSINIPMRSCIHFSLIFSRVLQCSCFWFSSSINGSSFSWRLWYPNTWSSRLQDFWGRGMGTVTLPSCSSGPPH